MKGFGGAACYVLLNNKIKNRFLNLTSLKIFKMNNLKGTNRSKRFIDKCVFTSFQLPNFCICLHLTLLRNSKNLRMHSGA